MPGRQNQLFYGILFDWVWASRFSVWTSIFQASGLGFGVSVIRSGLRHFRHQVWASTFQLLGLGLGLGFDVSCTRSGLRRSGHHVWASTFQALGLEFSVSDIKSGIRRFRQAQNIFEVSSFGKTFVSNHRLHQSLSLPKLIQK